jgi:hypothetical protein
MGGWAIILFFFSHCNISRMVLFTLWYIVLHYISFVPLHSPFVLNGVE